MPKGHKYFNHEYMLVAENEPTERLPASRFLKMALHELRRDPPLNGAGICLVALL
jgi:hypothetical protein